MTTVITRGAGSAQALGYAARATAANYIEDVFSTYLYTGNGTLQGIGNGIELGPDTGNSTYFNGGQINTNSSTSAFSLGTDAWTVECWIKSTYTSRIDPYELNGGTDASSGFFGLTINASSSGDIQWNEAVGSSASAVISATGTAIVNGSWHHVAITRSGNSVRMFLDGTQIGSTYTTSYTYGSANKAFRFGNRYPGGISSGSNFYISNFRIVKGTALYTSSFTPPSSSLTQISGTSYLAHQSISSNTDTTGIGNGYVNAATPSGLGPFNYGTGKGGLVWTKRRDAAQSHGIWDTLRGANNQLFSDLTAANNVVTDRLDSFSSTGFTLGSSASGPNISGATYCSWTFRKQAKFFDVVTYTGNGGSNRQISHSLNSTPGAIIIKDITGTSRWPVWHRSNSGNNNLLLNTTDNINSGGMSQTIITASATTFTVTDTQDLNSANTSGNNFVAYLFAHDAGGFGVSGSDNVITCGTYAGNGSGSGSNTISLGYEPQMLIIKRSSGGTGSWWMLDNMRGATADGNDALLSANSSAAETSDQKVAFTATGFTLYDSSTEFNASGSNYIYIAIRRGPMRTPTSGTSVFSPNISSGGSTTEITTGFPNDLTIYNLRGGAAANSPFVDRLRGLAVNSSSTSAALISSSTAAEAGYNVGYEFWNTSFKIGSYYGGNSNVFYSLRRAPGFFDEVCYTGTGSSGLSVAHNLSVAPELIIIKRRDGAGSWRVFTSFGASTFFRNILEQTIAGTSTSYSTSLLSQQPTSSNFYVGTDTDVNASGGTYVSYLFASCPGVSKVGTYTGSATTKQVDCGFTGGARFVLIKRRDTAGDWYVWDSARGIVAGNDPYLLLNSTAAEVTNTDYVDTYSAGFEISSTAPAAINANGGTFIFLAIA